MAVKVDIENFGSEVLKTDKPVLADFYSDSCIPCKMLSPVLSQIENEYADKIKVVKINTNFNSELTEKYNIQAAPTLVFFKDGKEIERLRGLVDKDEIIDIILSF